MCFRVFEPFDVFRPFSSGLGVSPLVAALDLRFYLGEVDAGITTTRATTATRFNEFGTQESVAADTLRIDYDPASLRTSNTSLFVGLGVRTLVLSATGQALGDPIRITRTGDAATFMAGRVVYVSGTTILVNVERKGGSGTYADWQVIKCRGALVEELRTNLLTYSEQFDNAAWGKFAVGTGTVPVVTPNAAVAPDGTMTADKVRFQRTATTSGDISVLQSSPTTATAIDYTGGLWVKASRAEDVGKELQMRHVAANVPGYYILTDEWQRVARTELGLAGSRRLQIGLIFLGTGLDVECYIWGAQLEAGASATSYIPTAATALTRNKDVVAMTGANFSDWYSASGFSMTAEIAAQASGTRVYWEISDGTVNNYISLRSVSGALALVVVTGGVEQANISLGTVTTGARYKIAAAWAANDVAASLGGAAVVTDASATLPTVARMHVGADGTAANQPCAPVLRMTGYRERVSNAQLQALAS